MSEKGKKGGMNTVKWDHNSFGSFNWNEKFKYTIEKWGLKDWSYLF